MRRPRRPHVDIRNIHWRRERCEHKNLHKDELLYPGDRHRIALCNDCGRVITL